MLDGNEPRMKETAADEAVKDKAYRATADELKQFVSRIENLEAEKAGIQSDIKEFYSEVRGRGYDVKALRKVIAERKKDPDQRAEQDALFEMYWDALQ